jgi:hypothetical protein
MRESITTLPTEIIEEIMSCITFRDIAALAQTSKRLRQVAAPRLCSFIPLLTARGIRRCIQCLAENPQRASQVLEVHLPKLVPGPKPPRWCFSFIARFLIATLDGVAPLPFFPVQTYAELSSAFNGALCNLAHLRVLVVHSVQHHEIWDNHTIIPSLRELFVYPGAESWRLWRWAMRQHSLATLRNCWNRPYWQVMGPTHCSPLVFVDLQTLITDPEGAAELLPKSMVSDLTIQNLSQPSVFSVCPIPVAFSCPVGWVYEPPFLYEIVRSNKRIPLCRITLSGRMDGIHSVLKELQLRDSLPPHVRVFLEHDRFKRDLVRPST